MQIKTHFVGLNFVILVFLLFLFGFFVFCEEAVYSEHHFFQESLDPNDQELTLEPDHQSSEQLTTQENTGARIVPVQSRVAPVVSVKQVKSAGPTQELTLTGGAYFGSGTKTAKLAEFSQSIDIEELLLVEP